MILKILVMMIGLLGVINPLCAEETYPIIVQLRDEPKIQIDDLLLQSTQLKLPERQAHALRSEVRRARFAKPAVELLGAIANAQDKADGVRIRYDDENLVLGTLFFLVNEKGEQFMKTQSQVQQVLKGDVSNSSRASFKN